MAPHASRAVLAIVAAAMLFSCGGNPPPPPRSGPELVKDGVVFRYRNPDAKTVHLVGDFNEWNPRSDAMSDENRDGEWTLYYPLRPGRYAYKFVVDGRRWIADPTNTLSEPDGFDGINSIVVVPRPGG